MEFVLYVVAAALVGFGIYKITSSYKKANEENDTDAPKQTERSAPRHEK